MTPRGRPRTTRYVIAVRRERRAEIGTDWVETLRDAPGVELAGAGSAARDVRRVTVHVTETGLEELRARVGAFCHIEPVIAHAPQRETGGPAGSGVEGEPGRGPRPGSDDP